MISASIVRIYSKQIMSFGVAIAIAAGLVSAQEIEPVTSAQEGSEPQATAVQKEQAGKADITIKEDQAPRSGLIAANSSASSPGPNKFATGFTVTQPPNTPLPKEFSKYSATAAQGTGSGWQFAFAPYLYMTGMTGTVGARGRVAEIDLDFVDVVENLNLGLMGAFEARKGRFVMTSDLLWIKLGEERETPGDLFSSAKLGVNMFVFDPEAGYRLYEGEGGSFDVLGGVRIMSIETNLNFRAGTLPGFDVSERKTWATPVFGAHGTLNLSPKFFLATKFDIGGGIGADFTAQFYGGAGYRIKPNIALVGGYRYVKTDYDSDSGFLFDTTMSGILIGAKFSF